MKATMFWIIAALGFVALYLLLGFAIGVGFLLGVVLAGPLFSALAATKIKQPRFFWPATLLLTLAVYFFLGGSWATGLIVGMVFAEIWAP